MLLVLDTPSQIGALTLVGLLATNLGITLGCMGVLWLVSVGRGDPSFVDAWWPIGFVVVAWVSLALGRGDAVRSGILAGATTVWGLRLGSHLFRRWRRNGPDRRYVSMLRHAPGNPHLFTLRKVFLLQGALLWIVSLPLQLGQWDGRREGVTALGWAGVSLFTVGFGFEAIGDLQLARFKADPHNDGLVMDRGLWRYTRHPNYFGDACVWWGLFLISVVDPVTAVGIVGPLVMTFLLARWSGVGPLERGLVRRKPDYPAYIASTSAFIPLPPRRRTAPVASEGAARP